MASTDGGIAHLTNHVEGPEAHSRPTTHVKTSTRSAPNIKDAFVGSARTSVDSKPVGGRERVSRAAARLGLIRIVEAIPRRRTLTVLNYHRIGNAARTEYDPGVFTATADEFEAQIAYLKRHFHIATLDEAVAMVEGTIPFRPSVLVTFDDGYLDNYLTAFPVLRAHNVQGVFFLPTAFVGTGRLPWWDVVAYMFKRTRKKAIHLSYPEPASFDLESESLLRTITRAATFFRRPCVRDMERALTELEDACDVARPADEPSPRFMSWDQAREMQKAGMAFGSHTHTHPMLTALTPDAVQEELRTSRVILEQQLGVAIETFAYPYGVRDAFSTESIRQLRDAGYRAAFSFYGGVNRHGRIDPFDIRRCDIGDSYDMFRLRMVLGAVTGSSRF